jgi:hypothetical protein
MPAINRVFPELDEAGMLAALQLHFSNTLQASLSLSLWIQPRTMPGPPFQDF